MLFFFGQAKKRGRASLERSIVKLFYNLMQPTTCWIAPPHDLVYTVKGEINKDSTPCSPCFVESLSHLPNPLLQWARERERERGVLECKIIEKVGG